MIEKEQKNGKHKMKIADEVRKYIETRLELFSLNIAEQVSRILAESFQQILGLFVLSFALFFLWFAVGFWVGGLIGSLSAGFAISSLPLFLLGYLLMNRTSESFTEKVQAELISKVVDDFENDQELEKLEGRTVEETK